MGKHHAIIIAQCFWVSKQKMQKGCKKMRKYYNKTGVLSEATEQENVFMWTYYIPECEFMYAVPNGGTRNRIEAANLKRQGVRAGVPDIVLPVARKGFHGLYIEMKAKKGGKTSDDQKRYIEFLTENGYLARVCKGAEEAVALIKEYLDVE